METQKGILPVCLQVPAPPPGACVWKELGCGLPLPVPLPTAFQKTLGESRRWLRWRPQGQAWLFLGPRPTAELPSLGREQRSQEGLVENSSLTRGRFKFSLCERRYLRSPLMEWVFMCPDSWDPNSALPQRPSPGVAVPRSLPRRGTQTTGHGHQAPRGAHRRLLC